MYKKLDIQLDKEMAKMNVEKMEANKKIQKVLGMVGNCPVSQ